MFKFYNNNDLFKRLSLFSIVFLALLDIEKLFKLLYIKFTQFLNVNEMRLF